VETIPESPPQPQPITVTKIPKPQRKEHQLSPKEAFEQRNFGSNSIAYRLYKEKTRESIHSKSSAHSEEQLRTKSETRPNESVNPKIEPEI